MIEYNERVLKAKKRWGRLPEEIKGQLMDYFNLWLAAANIVDGVIEPNYYIETSRNYRERGQEYKLVRGRVFRISGIEEKSMKDVNEHVAELKTLADEINEMIENEDVDLERLRANFNLAMVLMYGRERSSKNERGSE